MVFANSLNYPLTIEATNRGAFGYDFGNWGNIHTLHVHFVVNTYAIEGKEYLFSISGFDIDSSDEVSVTINGHDYGYLSVGDNDKLNYGDAIKIDNAHLVLGRNIIEIRQSKPNDGTWGVTNMYMSSSNQTRAPVVNISVGEVVIGDYGKGYGSSEHDDYLVVTFDNINKDLIFNVTGHEIRQQQIQVLLNDQEIGYLKPDQDIKSPSTFNISHNELLKGQNSLEFINISGNKWGISNLRLIIDK